MVQNQVAKADIVKHLLEIGELYSKSSEPWFKGRAYLSVSAAINAHEGELAFEDGKLKTKIKGAGDSITKTIEQFAATGASDKLNKLRKSIKAKDPKRLDAKPVREAADKLLAELDVDWGYAGSMRRQKPTVKDVDVIVCLHSKADKDKVAELLTKHGLTPDIRNGDKKWGITIPVGKETITLDLNFCTPKNRGAYYLYFTGSREFSIILRSRAKRMGLRLNEYGLFKGDTKNKLAGETEEAIFEALGLTYLEPKDREPNSVAV